MGAGHAMSAPFTCIKVSKVRDWDLSVPPSGVCVCMGGILWLRPGVCVGGEFCSSAQVRGRGLLRNCHPAGHTTQTTCVLATWIL